MRMPDSLTRIVRIVMAAGLIAPGAMGRVSANAGLVLVQDGRGLATIVTAAKPAENARLAAADLQRCLEKISGAKLPIATDASPPAGVLILVGASSLTDRIPDLKIPAGMTRNLREEGFMVRTVGDSLVLAGNDAKPYLGTRYAVGEFLHSLGVRWFLPGEVGEVVPNMPTIAVGPLDIRQQPDFPVRNWWEHAQGNMEAECREWKIHNKMNPDSVDAFGVPGDSSVGGFLPKDQFKEHPDWFALQRDGTRTNGHPCMSSDGMFKHFVERVKSDARRGASVSAFAPDDGMPRCWCEPCARLGTSFDGYGANDRDPVAEFSMSNEWFYFVNRILTEVNKEFPDYLIATNGYANRDMPPEMPPGVAFNPRKNLVVMFANIPACTIHAYDDPKCWQMRRQGQMIRRWCKLSDKVWMYNYNYTMLVNKGTITPMVTRLRRNIPLLKQWGVIGFNDQDEANWALSGLPTRLIRARLEWDTKADVDAILDDFYTRWFGRAAGPMKTYYDALEAAFSLAPQHGHEDVILRTIYSETLMAKLDASIKAAEAAAESQPEKYRLKIERAIYDNLREFVAMEKAKREGDLTAAVGHCGRMIEIKAEMMKLTPFMGWQPYPAYDIAWEKKRMEAAAAKAGGKEGELVAWLPETAKFKTDPFDDGRYERWQEPSTDLSSWRELATTSGWDAQGLHDEKGHPYRGVAWYQFDVNMPETAKGKSVFLHGLGAANEVWVWVNGRYAGHRPYITAWFRPHEFEFEVSTSVEPGRTNRVAVRVLCNYDVWGANGIYERMFLYAK